MQITSNQFSKLDILDIGDAVSTESLLFRLPNDMVYKHFLIDADANLYNKEKIIDKLLVMRYQHPFDELVFPTEKVYKEDKFSGYSMPYVNGINLKHFLKKDEISFDDKKEMLIKLGALLERLKRFRQRHNTQFYLNDLHEDNIMVNTDSQIRVVDIDSTYFQNVEAVPSRYLQKSHFFSDENKYKRESKSQGYYPNQIIPSQNTEIFCYIIMVLNFLLEDNIVRYGRLNAKRYVDYLTRFDIPKPLYESFMSIFEEKQNVSPLPYIEDIKENPKMNHKHFSRYKRLT